MEYQGETFSGDTATIPDTFLRLLTLPHLEDLPIIKGKSSVLEVGCGQGDAIGRILYPIVQVWLPMVTSLELSYTGVDIDSESLEIARAKEYPFLHNVCFQTGDARDLEFRDKQFSISLAIGLLTQLTDDIDVKQVISELKRVSYIKIIIDFQIVSEKSPLDADRIAYYLNRYEKTSQALNLPYGVILSTSDPLLEPALRNVIQSGTLEQIKKFYLEYRNKLRLSHHFDPKVIESWISEPSIHSTPYHLLTDLVVMNPSGNEVIEFAMIAIKL